MVSGHYIRRKFFPVFYRLLWIAFYVAMVGRFQVQYEVNLAPGSKDQIFRPKWEVFGGVAQAQTKRSYFLWIHWFDGLTLW
jgi:hypothetical protein